MLFFAKLLHAKPKHASGALDKIRTRRILREKADCKQSKVSRVSVISDNSYLDPDKLFRISQKPHPITVTMFIMTYLLSTPQIKLR